MIDSANQHPVHALLSHESNVSYRIPPYQREYSWQKTQWEELFQDLVEADGQHFLGTIITLNKTTDVVQGSVLELIDGQQRMTTLTLLLAAVHSILKEQYEDLTDDQRFDLVSLSRHLTRNGEPRLTPQTQGHNRDDYRHVLSDAGLAVTWSWVAYYPARKMSKCFHYFRGAIHKLAETESTDLVSTAMRILDATKQAVLVKIEVATHADAFVLFASLNNRGMPLTPVDLIKNHVLAEAERKDVLHVDDAFRLWSLMLSNLGDAYGDHERFLRHYYNAFKSELPEIANASVATKSKLIRIYETLLSDDLHSRVQAMVAASAVYGRITGTLRNDEPSELDRVLRQLTRAQGAPSYVLMLWLISKRASLGLADSDLITITKRLIAFFVRRNLSGTPQTYALPQLFIDIITSVAALDANDDVADAVSSHLSKVSVSDEEFRIRLSGPIYLENTDVARFILTTLCEDAMTKETWVDLWKWEKGRYVWTIEHVAPQGANLPPEWVEMLGGTEAAADAQEVEVHRLGNLTITAYNSTLSNKGFLSKRDRTDSSNRFIGYRNGLSLNADLATKEAWTVQDIEKRTQELVTKALVRFPV